MLRKEVPEEIQRKQNQIRIKCFFCLFYFLIHLNFLKVFLTWKDLIKVHSNVRIPSPRESSFTSLITRKSRKKVMEILALSSVFCSPLQYFTDRQKKKSTNRHTNRNHPIPTHVQTKQKHKSIFNNITDDMHLYVLQPTVRQDKMAYISVSGG